MSTNNPDIQSPVPYQPPADPILALVERAARDQTVDVDKMERLLALAERLHARKAETEFDQAMNAAQAAMRPVANDSDNPNTQSRYASYGALDKAVRPIYTEHGFSLSFGTRSPVPDRVTVMCRISHRAGHTERVEIDMPADGKGPKGGDVMTKTHATGSAVSYGMRYLLKMIFNISAGEYDDDGNAAGKAHRREPAQTPTTPPKPAGQPRKTSVKDETGWDKFLAACKTKLLASIKPDLYWAWWKIAVEIGWILPTEDLSAARPEEMFKGYQREDAKNSIASIVDRLRKTVEEFARNCPKADRDEILRSVVPRDAPPAPAVPGTTTIGACPECDGKAIKPAKDLIGALWCEKCGFQWRNGSPDAYEAYTWMHARLPFAPADPKKKDYKGMTLGQISRLDHKYWFGIVMNFEAKPWKGRPPTEEQVAFAEACELAREHLEQEKEEKQGERSKPDGGGPSGTNTYETEDDVPF